MNSLRTFVFLSYTLLYCTKSNIIKMIWFLKKYRKVIGRLCDVQFFRVFGEVESFCYGKKYFQSEIEHLLFIFFEMYKIKNSELY